MRQVTEVGRDAYLADQARRAQLGRSGRVGWGEESRNRGPVCTSEAEYNKGIAGDSCRAVAQPAWQTGQSASTVPSVLVPLPSWAISSAWCWCSWWPKCWAAAPVSCWQYVLTAAQLSCSGSSVSRKMMDQRRMRTILATKYLTEWRSTEQPQHASDFAYLEGCLNI